MSGLKKFWARILHRFWPDYLSSNNNNNQAFYFQASWGKLDMKPHELKKRYKTRVKKKGKTKGDKKVK
jgi:hypothetical protein